MIDIEGIRARLEGTTDGPWTYASGWILVDDGYVHVRIGDVPDEADGELMAHAREDIPALLAELDASNAEYAALHKAARDAFNALPGSGNDDLAHGILFDALGLDGAPQDGGVTDPHETSGPPVVAERFKSRPAGGTRVELVNRNGDRPHYHGNVAPDEAQPADPQRVRVRWDDLVTSTIRCEQLRPETHA